MELSRTAYLILGMIRLGRRTGYEIKQFVEVSTRFFWGASYGQIYPELARLEELGLIEGETDAGDGRRRRAYSLTSDGEEALHDWLVADELPHPELRHEGFLKLFFSDALSPAEQLDQVRRLRREHERVAEQLRAIEPGARAGGERRGTRFPYLTLEWGIAYQDFQVEWCERAERRLLEDLEIVAGG